METLSMNRMENLHGGVNCESALGYAAGAIAGGALIVATGGIGAFFAGAAIATAGSQVPIYNC